MPARCFLAARARKHAAGPERLASRIHSVNAKKPQRAMRISRADLQ